MASHALDSRSTTDSVAQAKIDLAAVLRLDQCSFDKTYKSMSLDDFVPALKSVLAKPKRSILISE